LVAFRFVEFLAGPFEPLYMQRAWLELALLALPAGALGAFVVLRRLAFASHALGVATFPGAVIAIAAGASVFAGGLAGSAIMAAALAVLARRRDLDSAAATGILLAGSLALGSVLVSDVFTVNASVDTLLFGSVLGVETADIVRSGAVAVVALGGTAALARGWFLVAFDRETAPAFGVSPAWLDVALFALLALTVVAAVSAVGSLLASALLVVPAATARLLVRRPYALVGLSVAVAVAVATTGLWLAFRTNAPPGATIAALATGVFVVVYAFRSLAPPARRRAALVAVAAGLLALAAGCGGSGDGGSSGDRVRVVGVTSQVADWARHVGGKRVEVTQLLKPLVDPHEFEPTPRDAESIARADLILASGAGLDDWIDGLVRSAGGDVTLVKVAPVADLHAGALGEGEPVDPHYWNDPTLAARAVATIARALANADPGDGAVFSANARRYERTLRSLDAELARELAAVPAPQRKMVTDHDAFGYLAARYKIEIVGAAIPSTSTAAEPSAKDTARLIDKIRAEGVCTVFSEESVDPKLVRAIAQESGASVSPHLYGDTLGPPGSGAATYAAMMRHNARTLVAGFLRTC
jgi:ABC-type Zn uptake system ZnuABC Zn-binding protein ZnuA/ABC-type Mn2+/Zn2+ transport system permease subunit